MRRGCRSACFRTARFSRSSTRRAAGRSWSTRCSARRSMAGSAGCFCGSAGRASVVESSGPGAAVDFGVGADRVVWAGEAGGVRHRVTLWLHPQENVWLWRVECNERARAAVRRDPGAGSGPRPARLPHEQRGLCLAIYRPSRRPGCRHRTGRHEPAEFGAGRPPPVGRAWLPRRRREFCDRCAAAFRTGLSRCRRNCARLRQRSAGRAAAARGGLRRSSSRARPS